jgi:single-stranded DNA-binding protein
VTELNLAIIEGHLAEDPVEHYDTSLTMSIICNRTYGKIKQKTVHTVFVEGKLGENCKKYLSKGSHVLVSGTLGEKGWIAGKEVKFLPSNKK